jgi:hypothetical protein
MITAIRQLVLTCADFSGHVEGNFMAITALNDLKYADHPTEGYWTVQR